MFIIDRLERDGYLVRLVDQKTGAPNESTSPRPAIKSRV
jgi:hypothetical protein